MRKLGIIALAIIGIGVSSALSDTLKDKTILYSAGHYLAGEPIPLGFDDYGYNYQAHMFNGSYANAYLGGAGFPPYDGDDDAYLADNPTAENHWTWPYRNDHVSMKWNEGWLSNQDQDGDGKLDRYYGYDSYIGSGAWLTNHISWMEDGRKVSEFVKIVAVPSTATSTAGVWYDANGNEIGPVIWGAFAIIQDVYRGGDYEDYRSPLGPGFGKYKAE